MHQPLVKELSKIITDNIDNADFSIELLCQKIGMSRSQLHRKLKEETGISTSLFIRKTRLEKAHELLINTTLNISEICYETGFISPQNFTKYFKAAYGMSPSKYRQALIKKEKQPEKAKVLTQAVHKELNIAEELLPPAPLKFLTKQKQTQLPLILGILGVFLLCLIFFFNLKSTATTKTDNEITIAILPFSQEGFSEDKYLGEGIAEDVLIHLNKIPTLKIIAKSSSFKYQKDQQTIQEIGRSLLATHVLEGVIKKENNEFNIFLQLIRIADNSVVWSEKYNGNNQNFLNVASAAALVIAEKLNQPISAEINQNIAHLSTKNIEAYNAYLLGNYLIKSRTKEELEKSIVQYELSLLADPNFIPAYVAKATAYFLLGDNGEPQYTKEAEKLALQIIKADKKNGEAYAILANVSCSERKFEQGLTFYQIALDYAPNNALINYWYSIRLREVGNFEKALAFGKLANELDPLHPVIHAGYVYTIILSGQYSLAEDILNKGETIFGSDFLHLLVKGRLAMAKKNYAEALSFLEASLKLNPNFRLTKIDKFACLAKMNKRKEVDAYMATLEEDNPTDCISLANIYSALNELDKGLFYLKKAADKDVFSNDLLVGAYYIPFRRYPIYLDVLKKSGLYEYFKNLEIRLISGNE